MLELAPAPLSADQLQALGEEIATFAARIDVAEHALLTRLRLFDAHEAWAQYGCLSCAQWLSWRIGIGPTAAREKVRVARALGSLEKVDALFSRGELSYSKVRAITRVATVETEQDFIDAAMHATAAQIEQLTRSYKRCLAVANGPGELPFDQGRFVRRADTHGGMVHIEMRLTPEEAAIVWEAIESARAGADVVGASAEAGGGVEPERADAIVDVARAYLKHRPRTLGSGYELVVLTSKGELESGQGGVGGCLRDGTPVPLHVAQMLACDCARVDVVVGEQGELLDVGRSTRTIPSAIGRALWLRDGGCRVPGCGRKQHLHGHHIRGWAEGGPTSLSNLVLVCSGHHRVIHEGGLSVEVRRSEIVFVDQRGRDITQAPRSATTGRELEELELFLRDEDLYIDPGTNYPQWDGTRMDLADSLGWMLMAANA